MQKENKQNILQNARSFKIEQNDDIMPHLIRHNASCV